MSSEAAKLSRKLVVAERLRFVLGVSSFICIASLVVVVAAGLGGGEAGGIWLLQVLARALPFSPFLAFTLVGSLWYSSEVARIRAELKGLVSRENDDAA